MPVSSIVSALGEEDCSGANRLLTLVGKERVAARIHMLGTLASARNRTLANTLQEAATHPTFSVEARVATEHQAVCVLPHLVNKPWKKLRVVARSITDESTDEDLHAVRIMAKRCRYCADTAAMVCGSDAARFAQASKCAGSPGQLPRHRHHRTVAAPSSANNTRCRTNGGPAHRRAEE